MTKQTTKTKAESVDAIKNCRVIEIRIGNFAECAQWGPVACPHAVSFGNSTLCLHPRVDEIIKNTKEALKAAKL